METMNYKIGDLITFKTKIFGADRIKTNKIKFIQKTNDKIIYFVGGVGKSLGIQLNGKEDCFKITEKNIIINKTKKQ